MTFGRTAAPRERSSDFAAPAEGALAAERHGLRLSPERGAFAQSGHARNFNIVAVSRDSQVGAA